MFTKNLRRFFQSVLQDFGRKNGKQHHFKKQKYLSQNRIICVYIYGCCHFFVVCFLLIFSKKPFRKYTKIFIKCNKANLLLFFYFIKYYIKKMPKHLLKYWNQSKKTDKSQEKSRKK